MNNFVQLNSGKPVQSNCLMAAYWLAHQPKTTEIGFNSDRGVTPGSEF